MVSKKRLDCGFNGYLAPVIPRAPRSIRKRGPRKKTVEDGQLCAFELLAAVAGKLLLESESSASSNVAERESQLGSSRDRNEQVQPKALKSESFDHGSCAESAIIPKISAQERYLLSSFNGVPQTGNDQVVEHNTVNASSVLLEKLDCDIKLGTSDEKSLDGNATCKIGSSNCFGESLNSKVESGSEVQSVDDKDQIGHLLSMANTSTVNDPINEHVNTNVLSNPESSVKFPLYRNSIPGALLKKCYNNVKLGIRDDDENSFRCNKSGTKSRPSRPLPRIVRHRMRKMMTSKYWKAAPKHIDYQLYNTSEGMKSFHRYRKSIQSRERCQRAPLKKRKLSDHSFGVAYDQEHSSDSISNLPVKWMRAEMNSSSSGASIKGHTKAKDPHVKFSIKSFKVPELYIDVPETATVGSLKRTVMDAVAAIMGGGIRVGVVYQGKKVRDDRRTLQQAGISECANPDNLGFVLEPSFTHVVPSETPKKFSVLSPHDADQSLPRSPISPMTHSGVSNASMDPLIVSKSDNVENNEYLSSPTRPDDAVTDGGVLNSKALILAPPLNVEALAAVPSNLKHKRSEMSQRRTRRPFSVAEVEALVEAVENLGTGRWRDVKMRSFEYADHRTYVDLKDKWKTLVHTASISPQQRRGEPVPQELLDRVLSAHSYWSQHQSRQHGKHPAEPLNLDSSEGILAA